MKQKKLFAFIMAGLVGMSVLNTSCDKDDDDSNKLSQIGSLVNVDGVVIKLVNDYSDINKDSSTIYLNIAKMSKDDIDKELANIYAQTAKTSAGNFDIDFNKSESKFPKPLSEIKIKSDLTTGKWCFLTSKSVFEVYLESDFIVIYNYADIFEGDKCGAPHLKPITDFGQD